MKTNLVLALLLSSVPVTAATHYVSPVGNDGGRGTFLAPWRTIQKAANSVVPGDTVYLREGTYRERVRMQRSGKKGAAITFTAYLGERAAIDGADIAVPRYDALLHLARVSYVRLVGFEVRNSAQGGIAVNAPSHVVLDGVEVHHCGASGIMFVGAKERSNTLVTRCEVHDCKQAGIVLWHNPGGYFTIARNEVWGNLYDAHWIVAETPLELRPGASVCQPFSGSAPDVGAFEFDGGNEGQ